MKRTLALLSLAAIACDKPATQLLVVIDTDFTVPAQLGYVRAVVRDETGLERSSLERELVADDSAADNTHAVLPASFAVVPLDGDAERTVTVEVEGRESRLGPTLVIRRAVTGFLPQKTLLLDMFLAKSCDGMDCGSGLTCTEDGCASENIDPNDLPQISPGNEIMPRDAGGTDAGPDGGGTPDGGPDGGEPDDAGVMDSMCPASPGAPAVIGSVRVPHPIEHPLLTADVDGDGVGEILAASDGDGTSQVTIIDFDACGAPGLVTAPVSGDLRRAPAFTTGMSGPEIWLPVRTALEAWRYDRSLGTPLERSATIFQVMDLEGIAISSDGNTAGMSVRHTNWGTAHVNTQTRQENFTELADRPRSLTYVGEVASGALFAGASPSALHFFEPGTSTSLPFVGLSDPMSIGPDPAFGSASAAIVVARADRAVVAVRIDLSTRATATSSMSFPRSIVGEPVLARSQNEVRVYVRLDNDLLTWCTLSANASSVQCVPANPADGFNSGAEVESEYNTNHLTAYLDEDAIPDVVMVNKEGEVHFRSGVRLADPAAPMVRVNGESKLPSALIPRFWTSFGATGDLLAVPLENGTIILISWAAPAAAPASTDALWTQPRRDAHRSAHIP